MAFRSLVRKHGLFAAPAVSDVLVGSLSSVVAAIVQVAAAFLVMEILRCVTPAGGCDDQN
jgi:hypothetical protein